MLFAGHLVIILQNKKKETTNRNYLQATVVDLVVAVAGNNNTIKYKTIDTNTKVGTKSIR